MSRNLATIRRLRGAEVNQYIDGDDIETGRSR